MSIYVYMSTGPCSRLYVYMSTCLRFCRCVCVCVPTRSGMHRHRNLGVCMDKQRIDGATDEHVGLEHSLFAQNSERGIFSECLWLQRPRFQEHKRQPTKRRDLTFWLQSPVEGVYHKACFVGSLCVCGHLGPYSFHTCWDGRGLDCVLHCCC